MTHDDYLKLILFRNIQNSALVPENELALDLLDSSKHNEVLAFRNVTPRDLKLHGGYFIMLTKVRKFLPKNIKDAISDKKFYSWVRIQSKQYDVDWDFGDGTKMITPHSISFGKMNNSQFKDYIKTQIPHIYNIFMKYLPEYLANIAIMSIEEGFERFFTKL